MRYHHSEVVKLLTEEDPEFSYGANSEGNTPLYIAADRGFRDLVQVILDKSSSPAHSGIKGRTALHAAVILNDQGMVRHFLKTQTTSFCYSLKNVQVFQKKKKSRELNVFSMFSLFSEQKKSLQKL